MKEVGEGEEQDREGGRECAEAQRSGRDRMQRREREKREGEVKDRGREHEEEAEEEGREAEEEGREKEEEGEISSCQMVSNKTSASSQQPRLNSNIKKKRVPYIE